MPNFEVEFEVFCANRRNMPFVGVKPCPQCISNAKDEGYNCGYNSGYDKSFNKGGRE